MKEGEVGMGGKLREELENGRKNQVEGGKGEEGDKETESFLFL
jgi:hypothetical protein